MARCDMIRTVFGKRRFGIAGLAVAVTLAAWMGISLTAASAARPRTPAPTPDWLKDALTAAIQDEYHAQAIYEGVVNDLGRVSPFVNIIRAEQRHAASLGNLFRKRGLPVPASNWNAGNVPHFATRPAACAAAAQAEVGNAAVYDRYLGLALPTDVRRVFENNRAASLNNHLPAFDRCK
jgi:hypothetical protein